MSSLCSTGRCEVKAAYPLSRVSAGLLVPWPKSGNAV